MHFSSSVPIILSTVLTLLGTAVSSDPSAKDVEVHLPDVPFIPTEDLPPPNPASKCDEIVTLFKTLSADTKWEEVQKTHFKTNTGEPEGMVRLGDDRYFVSAGEFIIRPIPYPPGVIINGTDRSAGEGHAHLLLFDGKGNFIADATHSVKDDIEYHPGGIDYDGEFIWSAIAQYRPNTTARVVKIDPRTMEAETVFRTTDHFGAVVHDTQTNSLVGLNWAARNASTWDLSGQLEQRMNQERDEPEINSDEVLPPTNVVQNPYTVVDYQDCKFLGHPKEYEGRAVMICSGVSGSTGGIALVDMETMEPLAEVPIAMKSGLGKIVTQNPFDVDVVDGRLRLYFLPDMIVSSLYVYEAQ